MKLYRLNEIIPDGSGQLYRQSRFASVLMTLVLGGIFTGAPLFWWYVEAPWLVTGLCALLAMFVVPLLIGDLRAKVRDTNWLLWLRPDGVWINFRSYQDNSPADAKCVLRLEYAEIAQARKHVEQYSTPSNRGSTRHMLKCLDLELTHDETALLDTALAENRRRQQPQRSYFGISVTSRPAHFPVSLRDSQCIRIAWRGGPGNWVAPGIAHVLAELSGYVAVADATRRKRADWRDLGDQDLDDQILELARAGATIDAVKLLVSRRGYTTTEARQFVDELQTPASATGVKC